MRVADVVAHVRTIERALVAALADAGLAARARVDEGADYTGVWVAERKIASIGVHVARGVSTHGFAVNVENDLQPFEWIVPCGLEGVRMTSVSRERRDPGPGAMPAFRAAVVRRFAEAFERVPRNATPAELGLAAPAVR
jgi:lipoyl(octanoyl) transferase